MNFPPPTNNQSTPKCPKYCSPVSARLAQQLKSIVAQWLCSDREGLPLLKDFPVDCRAVRPPHSAAKGLTGTAETLAPRERPNEKQPVHGAT